jgi:ATP-binding cassette subfamily B protein RaxB
MLFAFTAYAGQFTGRTASLIDKYSEFRMLELHSERLAEIVLEAPETKHEFALNAEHLVPRIELINLGFRYSDNDSWILRKVNLTIEAAEMVALVGPSGCGKTTLLKLMLGLLVPTEGEIRYGGIAIDKIGLKKYREMVGVVMQDDQLLSGSLGDNICFFASERNQERIEACAKLAAIHDDIMAMPMQYHTLSNEMGISFSGGQRQRIFLARALYKQPKILMLDEATSHLDVDRERLVNEGINSLSITRISIAHRPETVAMANRVIRIHAGEIAEDMTRLAVAQGT